MSVKLKSHISWAWVGKKIYQNQSGPFKAEGAWKINHQTKNGGNRLKEFGKNDLLLLTTYKLESPMKISSSAPNARGD